MNKKEHHAGYEKPGGEMSDREWDGMVDHTMRNEKEGGFGGDPEENFFRGEILYEDADIVLGQKRSDDLKRKIEEVYSMSEEGDLREYDPEEDDPEEYDSEEDSPEEDDWEEDGPEEDSGLLAEADAWAVRSAGEQKRMKEKTNKKAAGKKKKKSFLRRLLRSVLLIAAVVLFGLYLAVGLVYGKMNYSAVDSVKGASCRDNGVINILLIGNDSRENGEDGRSDAMILLSVSSRTKTIQMTSLLRDMYVDIPGHDGNRLNAAYAFGGPELLMETIKLNLGIEVNRYVLVNFEAFANLVDAVGGVDLELTNDEVQYVNGYLVEYNMLTGKPEGTDYLDTTLSGMIHLNGPQALAYSRNRYIGTDFGRTERQRKVLSGVIQNLPRAVLKNPMKLMDGLLPNLTTNLTKGECYLLSLQAGKLLSYDLVQGSVPVEGSYQNATIRGMAVLQVDFEKNKEYLKNSIYGE